MKMEFSKVIETRRSLRGYDKARQVTDEQLMRIIQAARLAPTAANRQAYKLVVIKNTSKILDFVKHKFIWQAPIVVAIFVDETKSWERNFDLKNFAWVDGSIVFEHVILAATAEGLATVWVANEDPSLMEKVCKVPPNYKFLALTPIGYATEEPRELSRKSVSELISYID
jgi:nitroreductase